MTLSDKEILKKVIDGKSSAENAECVANWFSSTIEGQQTLSDLIDQDAYLMEEDQPEETSITPFQSNKIFESIDYEIRKRKVIKMSLRIVAIIVPFLFLIGGSLYLNRYLDLNSQTIYTEILAPKGEKTRIVFQDGSEAILNADSKIRYPQKFRFSKREVFLEGEAYFNISANKHRPFIVNTEKSNIAVLGTSFNVLAYDNNETIEVTLDEGSIIFNTTDNKYQLKPGQQLIFNKNSEEYTIKSLNNSKNNSLWTSNILYFEDAPLKQVIETLERKFDISFSVKDNYALTYSYTIKTEARTIEEIISELEIIAPVKFTLYKGIYEITH